MPESVEQRLGGAGEASEGRREATWRDDNKRFLAQRRRCTRNHQASQTVEQTSFLALPISGSRGEFRIRIGGNKD